MSQVRTLRKQQDDVVTSNFKLLLIPEVNMSVPCNFVKWSVYPLYTYNFNGNHSLCDR